MVTYTDLGSGAKRTIEGNTKSPDRIIELKVIDGKDALNSTGLVDKRLFTGENRLHGILGPDTLWHFKYDDGGLPEALRGQKFTSFPKLLTFARDYFAKRNIEISKVIE